ncbi:MAG: hypothetical protein IPG17_14970 [Sandaracinaceae bacterium]|nr:hypothetical protein [Sandaracinaceae bacterium]
MKRCSAPEKVGESDTVSRAQTSRVWVRSASKKASDTCAAAASPRLVERQRAQQDAALAVGALQQQAAARVGVLGQQHLEAGLLHERAGQPVLTAPREQPLRAVAEQRVLVLHHADLAHLAGVTLRRVGGGQEARRGLVGCRLGQLHQHVGAVHEVVQVAAILLHVGRVFGVPRRRRCRSR